MPLSLGQNVRISSEEELVEDYTFDRHLYPEYYDSYNTEEISSFIEYQNYDVSTNYGGNVAIESNPIEMIQLLDGPMDSAWPMHGHDPRNTGRSPYSTASNPGEEKWWYKTETSFIEGSPVIDKNGVIYFGSWDNHLYAINPDGTVKWKYDIQGNVETSPAIDENGVIYVGTHFSPGYGTFLFAINPNGTLKWKYPTSNIYSSPVIADDGMIIFCDSDNWNINAIYPNNGTIKWCYHAGTNIYSSPAIGDDGTIYVGSIDNLVYALYPNNGTVKWKFNTGTWVHGSPTIADDGTIYIGADNGYLYALYPNNGTVKWQCNVRGAVWCTPALDNDGNIYVGTWDKEFFAIYPNGTIKWDVQVSHNIWGMSPVVSDDGIIYFGTCDFSPRKSGPFYALNPDGTTRWRMEHARMFFASPAIGSDGTIYICTQKDEWIGWGYRQTGRLRALSELDPNAPSASDIDGPTNGKIEILYDYTFISDSPLGNDVYYYVDWGDEMNSGWVGPYGSGEVATVSHGWQNSGDFTIRAKVKDTDNLWGPWGEFSVNMKVRNRAYSNTLLLRLLEQFPNASLLLRQLLEL